MGGATVSATGPVIGETRFWHKASIRPMFFCSLAVFGAITYGYDGTYFTSILEMDKFKQDFGATTIVNGNPVTDITSSQRSAVTSAVQAGEFCGALLAGPIGDWSGRRGAFFGAIFFLTLGTILQLIVPGSLPLLGIGRAFVGMGVGFLANTTPLYLSEVSTVAVRGAVVGSWQLLLAIGQVIGACVGQGTHALTTTAAYRIPIGLNLLWVVILFISQFIIPESPRWLVAKGRDEEAKKALMRINKDQKDPDLVVEMQHQSFLDSHNEEVEMGKAGWASLLKGVEARKLAIVCGILAAQQIGGVQFIFSYTTTFFAKSGVADSFVVTIIVDVIEVVGVICSFFIVNRFGRRPLLIYSSIPMFISLFVAGGLGRGMDGTPETAIQNRVLVAMICIYVFFFNLCWGPLAWCIASEFAVGRNRQKLMSLGSAMFFIWAFIVSFTLPYLFDDDQAALGTNIGWIYGVGTIIALAFVFFVVPESRGRSLEEINEMINAKVPARKWTTYVTSLQREGGKAKIGGSASSADPSLSGHSEEVDAEDKQGKEGKAGGDSAIASDTRDLDTIERQ